MKKFFLIMSLIFLLIVIETNAQIQDQSDNRLSIVVPKATATNIDFGKVLNKSIKDSVFAGYLKNTGKFPVRIDKITLGGSQANEFQLITNVFPFTIQPNGNRNIEFRFAPKAVGVKTADVIISQADTLHNTISGESVEPKIGVFADIVDFGKVPVFSNSEKNVSAAIKNIGSSSLRINSVEIDNVSNSQFSINEEINSFSLNPGDVKSLNLAFNPIKEGRTDGKILINYENNNDPIIIKLYGEGLPIYATIKGTVKTTDGKPLDVKVGWELMSENFTNVEIGTIQSSAIDGSYEFKVPIGSNYAYYFQKQGFMDYSDNAILKNQKKDISIINNIIMRKPCDSVIIVKNIFFDFNKIELKPESFTQLERLIEQLKECNNKKIEVSGHTDNIGNASYNQKLSQDRASSVVNYLISKGIKKENLITKGYGLTKPVADNSTDEGRAKNRRVEFKFLKK